MTRYFAVAVLAMWSLAGLAPQPALAKTIKLGGDSPIARVELPDSWEPEEITFGVEAFSPDESVYLSIEVADVGNIDDVTAESDKFLRKKGVELLSSEPESVDTEANGMPVTIMRWKAKRKREPMLVEMAVYKVTDKRTLITQNFGTEAGMVKYAPALAEIFASLAPLRK